MASPFVETVFPIGHGEPVQIVSGSFSRSVTPHAWFWNVTSRTDGSPIYSSAAAAYMPDTDSRYTDWLAEGNVATVIATDGELADVLAKAGQTGSVVLNTQPTAWGACTPFDISGAVAAAGVQLIDTVNTAISAHYQLTGPFDTMQRTQVYINAHSALPNNNEPIMWPAYDKTVILRNTADFESVYKALQDYFDAWQNYTVSGGTAPAWGAKTIP
jgi:hypothetical protein